MNTYTIVFKKRGTEHRWVIKRTSDNFVVARSAWFSTFTLCVNDLREFLNWMLAQGTND